MCKKNRSKLHKIAKIAYSKLHTAKERLFRAVYRTNKPANAVLLREEVGLVGRHVPILANEKSQN